VFDTLFFDQVLLAGDLHGDARLLSRVLDEAAEYSLAGVVVVGDFGYQTRSAPMLSIARGGIATHGVSVLFLDGNHEDHTLLRDDCAEAGVDLSSERVPVWLGGGLFYLPRGSHISVGELDVTVMGGAASIDKKRHIRDGDWFAQETISDEDISFARQGDVLLSHDAPSGWRVPDLMARWGMAQEWLDELPRCEQHREVLRRAYEVVQPHLIVHGHYHSSYRTSSFEQWGEVSVAGLNACGWNGWGTILKSEKGKGTLFDVV
jgi:Icc-related predicted phosphoesterase